MNDVYKHLKRVQALLKSPLYSKEDLKKMSPKQIKEAYDNIFKTHNSRRKIQ